MAAAVHCFLNNFTKILFGLTLFSMARAEVTPQVLTSIKPLTLITLEITRGTSIDVNYLISPTTSEHSYALKISDVQKLQAARLIIWLDKDLEPYLYKTQDKWLEKSTPVKSLPLLPGLNFEKVSPDNHREGAKFYELSGLNSYTIDPHIWLSPILVQKAAEMISERLGERFPDDKAHFDQNLIEFKQKLAVLNSSTATALAPYKNHPFLVYHNAYGYFEQQYTLNQIGTIHTQPGAMMSLKQLSALQNILDKQITEVCLFREPQFALMPVPTLKTRNTFKLGTLDPLGIEAKSYVELINNLTGGFIDCFENTDPTKKEGLIY